MICDELDRLDPGGAEGDPLAIASRRSETFPDSFRIQVSSPTIRGRAVSRTNWRKPIVANGTSNAWGVNSCSF